MSLSRQPRCIKSFQGRIIVPAKIPASKSRKSTRSDAKTVSAKKKASKPSAAVPAQKLSALAAAARVLAETKKPMSCPELIAAMAAHGYWASPTGKTPAATLSSALQREIVVKKDQARFQKIGPGRYALA
jgi:hypothetical protein